MQYNMQNFENILLKIIVILNSKFKNENTDLFFKSLKTMIKELKIDSLYSKENIDTIEMELKSFQETSAVTIDYNQCKSISNHFKNITIQAQQYISHKSLDKNERNAYYNPEFSEQLVILCFECFIWSKVMFQEDDQFEIETECNHITSVESYCKDFQNHLINSVANELVTLDKCLIENINFNEKILEATRYCIPENQKVSSNKAKKLSLGTSYIQYKENWMGMNDQADIESSDEDCIEQSNDDYSTESQSDSEQSFELDFDSTEDLVDFEDKDITTIVDSICEDLTKEHLLESSENNDVTKLASGSRTFTEKKDGFLECSEIVYHDEKSLKMMPGLLPTISTSQVENCDDTSQNSFVLALGPKAELPISFTFKDDHQANQLQNIKKSVVKNGTDDLEELSDVAHHDKISTHHDQVENCYDTLQNSFILSFGSQAEPPMSSSFKDDKGDQCQDIKKLSENTKQDFEIPKKRGKYLEPCNDLDLLEQKPLSKPKKRSIIKNYNIFKPKKVDKKKQMIKTSSYFDSIFEIFITAYFSVGIFQNFLSNHTDIIEGIKQELTENLTTHKADVCAVDNLKAESPNMFLGTAALILHHREPNCIDKVIPILITFATMKNAHAL